MLYAASSSRNAAVARATLDFVRTTTDTSTCVDASLRANLLAIQGMLEQLHVQQARSIEAGQRVEAQLEESLEEPPLGPSFVRGRPEVEDESSDSD